MRKEYQHNLLELGIFTMTLCALSQTGLQCNLDDKFEEEIIMSNQSPLDLRTQLGALIGLGCPECEGYVTVDFVDTHKYQACCENCGHCYWVSFNEEALGKSAPQLLAACVLLVGTILRDSNAAPIGSPGYQHVQQALKAIAQATGYTQQDWKKLTEEIKRATQHIQQLKDD
jgi:stage V sporulation protein SpoVS